MFGEEINPILQKPFCLLPLIGSKPPINDQDDLAEVIPKVLIGQYKNYQIITYYSSEQPMSLVSSIPCSDLWAEITQITARQQEDLCILLPHMLNTYLLFGCQINLNKFKYQNCLILAEGDPQQLYVFLQYLVYIGISPIVVNTDNYQIQRVIQDNFSNSVVCLFAATLQKTMIDYTNGTGFDLVIEINSPTSSDKREVLHACGMLATWIVVSDDDTSLQLDPPEAKYMSSKRISLVMATSTVDSLHKNGMQIGVLKNIIEEVVKRYQEGIFKNLVSERPKVRFDIDRDDNILHLIKIE